jgi:phosphoesterase RecJ-like protein
MAEGFAEPQVLADFRALLEAVDGQEVAVVGHARPDGDCIGSQVALARVLRSQGMTVRCINPHPVPRRLAFVAQGETFTDVTGLDDFDGVAIYVDCADHDRPGPKLRARLPDVLGNIDHHVSNTRYARHNCVSSSAAATCEILAAVFLDAGLPIDPVTAQALYTGIVTDTGQFRFASTTQTTFQLTAEIVARGANPVTAGFELYERESPGKVQLLQRFLASFETYSSGRICLGTLANGVFDETGTSPEDTEGMVDYARAIDGVDIGGLIEERADGVKCSLRSNDPRYGVHEVAALFQGGGHACAAGLNLPGMTLAEFRPRLVAALQERLAAVDAVKET